MTEVDRLARRAEEVRRRLNDDLEQLWSPSTLSGFKEDLLTQARELRHELLDRPRQTASETGRRVWRDLQERAAANPAAALAVGAGVAWHIAQRPPLALVGIGLASLIGTEPLHPAGDVAGPGELAEA